VYEAMLPRQLFVSCSQTTPAPQNHNGRVAYS
jgi:hypothetical protein